MTGPPVPAADRSLATIVLATRNPKKLRELERILRPARPDLALRTLEGFSAVPAAPEDGETFAENARSKAIWYSRATGEACLADDSGLEVDALAGAPGVRSARYAGTAATDAENRARLLFELAGVPAERRGARFRCALALVRGDSVLFECEAVTEGTIASAERGRGGFGYDPLFHSSELGCTFAEADATDKDRVSHRGRALARLVAFLRPTTP